MKKYLFFIFFFLTISSNAQEKLLLEALPSKTKIDIPGYLKLNIGFNFLSKNDPSMDNKPFASRSINFNYSKPIFLNDNFKNFNLIISYQGCADAGLCYPPITKTFIINQKSDSGFYYKKVNLPEDQISISNLLYDKTILVNIFLFFIAGILLSFTPCVFPMIPILTGLIVGQGDNISTKKSFLLSEIVFKKNNNEQKTRAV